MSKRFERPATNEDSILEPFIFDIVAGKREFPKWQKKPIEHSNKSLEKILFWDNVANKNGARFINHI